MFYVKIVQMILTRSIIYGLMYMHFRFFNLQNPKLIQCTFIKDVLFTSQWRLQRKITFGLITLKYRNLINFMINNDIWKIYDPNKSRYAI